MRTVWAIAAREYASMFRIPLGWVSIALFLALSGVLFSTTILRPGEPATLRPFFVTCWLILVVVAPSISMRLFSEEIRTGTIEPLLTAPLHEANIVVGKFLGAALFLCTMLAPTLLYVVLLELLSRPDYGPIIAGYAGVILLGCLYLAVGTLVSCLTASQTLAFLGTLFALMGIDVATRELGPRLTPPLSDVVFAISPSLRLEPFAKGLINTGDVAFFVVASVWFLAMATIVLESRRWR